MLQVTQSSRVIFMILNPELQKFPRQAHLRYTHGKFVMVRATEVKRRKLKEKQPSMVVVSLMIVYWGLLLWNIFKAKTQTEFDALLIEVNRFKD